MMGERRVMQEALFYGFSFERHVPDDHLLRKIDRFIDLSEVRAHLGPYYSDVGRPSIVPELMIRMFGYGFGIRSERRLCEEVHLNLAIAGSVDDDAAFGGATPVEPKAISPTDPAARYTAAADKPAVYAYSDNYLIDLKHAVIMDVEATTAIRQAEVGAAKTMLDRTAGQCAADCC